MLGITRRAWSPRRPLLALTLAAAAVLVAGAFAGGRAPVAHAATAAPLPAGTVSGVAPYALEGFRWSDRTTVDVYYTWDGGACTVNGRDLGGPPAGLTTSVAHANLDAAIQEIDLQLRGGLKLVDAGPASRAELCSTDPTHAIVVGWGSIASTGLTLNFGLQPASGGTSRFTAARVFLSDTYDFACPGAPTYRDLQHVFTHELMHAIGIGHSTDPNAIMAPTGIACEMGYLLTPDDIAALAALYPPVLPPPTATPAPAAAVAVAPSATPVSPSATPSAAAGGTGHFDRPVASTGVSTALWGGGSVVELASAVQASGGTSVTVFVGGRPIVYIPGAPAFVNAAFTAVFPGGVPASTIVLIVH